VTKVQQTNSSSQAAQNRPSTVARLGFKIGLSLGIEMHIRTPRLEGLNQTLLPPVETLSPPNVMDMDDHKVIRDVPVPNERPCATISYWYTRHTRSAPSSLAIRRLLLPIFNHGLISLSLPTFEHYPYPGSQPSTKQSGSICAAKLDPGLRLSKHIRICQSRSNNR